MQLLEYWNCHDKSVILNAVMFWKVIKGLFQNVSKYRNIYYPGA